MKKLHLDQNLEDALAQMRSLVDTMATRAENTLGETLTALDRCDGEAAKRIISDDRQMNALEVEIDERCLKLLARWQPVASDLRTIAAAFKLTVDLERIGDHCVNICERVLDVGNDGAALASTDLKGLGVSVSGLIHDAFVALRAEDAQLANQVIERGQHNDVLVRHVLRSGFESLQASGTSLAVAVRTHEIAGYLQRIAAHATNVAEMVIFLVRGEDVRHLGRRAAPLPPGDDSASR